MHAENAASCLYFVWEKSFSAVLHVSCVREQYFVNVLPRLKEEKPTIHFICFLLRVVQTGSGYITSLQVHQHSEQ